MIGFRLTSISWHILAQFCTVGRQSGHIFRENQFPSEYGRPNFQIDPEKNQKINICDYSFMVEQIVQAEKSGTILDKPQFGRKKRIPLKYSTFFKILSIIIFQPKFVE